MINGADVFAYNEPHIPATPSEKVTVPQHLIHLSQLSART